MQLGTFRADTAGMGQSQSARGTPGLWGEGRPLQNEEGVRESFPRRRHGRMTRMLAQGGGVDSWDSTRRGVEARSSVPQ